MQTEWDLVHKLDPAMTITVKNNDSKVMEEQVALLYSSSPIINKQTKCNKEQTQTQISIQRQKFNLYYLVRYCQLEFW